MAQQRPVIVAAAAGRSNNKYNPIISPKSAAISTTSTINHEQHYDNHDHEDGLYERSCPTGQFFLNPGVFLWLRCQRIKVRCIARIQNYKRHRRRFRWGAIHSRTNWDTYWLVGAGLLSLMFLMASVYLLYLSTLDPRKYEFHYTGIPELLITAIGGVYLAPKQQQQHTSFLRWQDNHQWDRQQLQAHDANYSLPDYGGLTLNLNLPDFGGMKIKLNKKMSSYFWKSSPQQQQTSKVDVADLHVLPDEDKNPRRRRRKIDKRSFDDYYRIATGAKITKKTGCQGLDWETTYYSNCNLFHEYDLSRDWVGDTTKEEDVAEEKLETKEEEYDADYESYYIASGHYRDVWILDHKLTIHEYDHYNGKNKTKEETQSSSHPPHGKTDKMALKLYRAKYNITTTAIQDIAMDAVIMERLTASPRIINIYGYCSTSIAVEAVPIEVEEIIVPDDGALTSKELHGERTGVGEDGTGGKREGLALEPKNGYRVDEKLTIALEMAEGIADLHGFRDGVIVHDDIQLCQWMRREGDGKLLFGDFNRATVMQWNVQTEKYCKFNNGGGYGNYRSPEEFDLRDLDEKIDVFSFGNNIYGLLTGLWVFYENEDDGVIQDEIINGTLAFIDNQYRHGTFAEQKLVEVMERCWKYKAEERIDIFEVVKLLRSAVEENNRLSS